MGVATWSMAEGGARSRRSSNQQVLLGFGALLGQFSTAGINEPVRNLCVNVLVGTCMKLIEIYILDSCSGLLFDTIVVSLPL